MGRDGRDKRDGDEGLEGGEGVEKEPEEGEGEEGGQKPGEEGPAKGAFAGRGFFTVVGGDFGEKKRKVAEGWEGFEAGGFFVGQDSAVLVDGVEEVDEAQIVGGIAVQEHGDGGPGVVGRQILEEVAEGHQRGEVEEGEEVGDARVGGEAFLFAEFKLGREDFLFAGVDAGRPEWGAGEGDEGGDFAGFRFAFEVEEGEEGGVHGICGTNGTGGMGRSGEKAAVEGGVAEEEQGNAWVAGGRNPDVGAFSENGFAGRSHGADRQGDGRIGLPLAELLDFAGFRRQEPAQKARGDGGEFRPAVPAGENEERGRRREVRAKDRQDPKTGAADSLNKVGQEGGIQWDRRSAIQSEMFLEFQQALDAKGEKDVGDDINFRFPRNHGQAEEQPVDDKTQDGCFVQTIVRFSVLRGFCGFLGHGILRRFSEWGGSGGECFWGWGVCAEYPGLEGGCQGGGEGG